MTTTSATRRPVPGHVSAPLDESYSDRPRSSRAVGARRPLAAFVIALVAAARGR